MYGVLAILYARVFNLNRTLARLAARREERMTERAIRKNGIAWLAEIRHIPNARHLQLEGIGEGLRARFGQIFEEPAPAHFLELLQWVPIPEPRVRA